MERNINYKPISKDLEKMVKPFSKSNIRSSLGLESSIGEFYYISVEDLIPFHNQSRKTFNESEITSLADSIKIYGIRQPLTVLNNFKGQYEVVSGERRLKAAKQIGLDKVPCIIIEDPKQADAIALVENIHRKDLHPLELGNTYKNLLKDFIFNNQTELAQKIFVNKSHISEYIKYAELPFEIQEKILENNIQSRDKLRNIIKAYEKKDENKLKSLLDPNLYSKKKNFSILRISSIHGKMHFQEKGIEKLTMLEKNDLKNILSSIINKL